MRQPAGPSDVASRDPTPQGFSLDASNRSVVLSAADPQERRWLFAPQPRRGDENPGNVPIMACPQDSEEQAGLAAQDALSKLGAFRVTRGGEGNVTAHRDGGNRLPNPQVAQPAAPCCGCGGQV